MNHLSEVEEKRACTTRHYNCAQSLLVPFRDVTGLSEEQSDRLGNLFGSGMHHGGLCGVLNSAVMILSLAGFGKDTSTALIRDFRQKHASTLCRDLLAASAQKGIVRKEHCDGLVFEMTKYLDEVLENRSGEA
jgi:C_GCAxxG_C_C family probable redox protein